MLPGGTGHCQASARVSAAHAGRERGYRKMGTGTVLWAHALMEVGKYCWLEEDGKHESFPTK